MKQKERLREWQDKYETAKSARGDFLNAVIANRNQYDGKKDGDGNKEYSSVWNITFELLECEIDSNIPAPKVTPARPNERTIRNARVIEDMIKNELDRMETELLNDEEERAAKIDGGVVSLIEWDRGIKTHDTIGDLAIKLIYADQFIPQEGVYIVDDMDYFFIDFEDTKQRIKSRYGKDVSHESSENTSNDEIITHHVCFYMNKDGRLGCISWVGDTVIIDDKYYEARKDSVCVKCGATQPVGEKVCRCGSTEWEKRDKEFETLEEDLTLSDGRTIPAVSPAREDGEYLYEDYEEPVVEQTLIGGQLVDMPVMDIELKDGLPISDGMGGYLEKQRTQTKQRLKYEYTKIPLYYPHKAPVAVRKNISERNNVLGRSDCFVIADLQRNINRLQSKRDEVLMKAGSVITVPKGSGLKFTDEALRVVEVKPEEQGLISVRSITADVSQFSGELLSDYDKARSTIGVNDSSQGKPDTTATSGRAKEAQIAQAAGRTRSKRVMKNAAAARKYELMFKFMLAYSDEPRAYRSVDENGQMVERIFNKYDFLECDDNGDWYYDDQYLFAVDESGIDQHDMRYMLDDLRTDLGIGAYGNIQDPKTRLRYWQQKEAFGYANAAQNVTAAKEEIEEMQNQMGGDMNALLAMQNGNANYEGV